MAHSVATSVETSLGDRNRVTTAFRPILAIPHVVLAGPNIWSTRGGGVGLLGAAAYVLAVVSWFTLLVKGEQFEGIREFCCYYLRWRTRALSYLALFRDEYPPFGDAPYPATIQIGDPPAMRDRTAIALRLLLAVPHLLVVALLLVAWFITTVIAWVTILLTRSYPPSLYAFGVSVMQWTLRVEAYLLLLVDDYPPFQLE